MARNNKVRLINYHSATASAATAADLSLGEIAVLHKSKSDAKLQVKIDDSNLASFISEDAINSIKEKLQEQINHITGEGGSLSDYLTKTDASNTYETKTDAATKKTDAISSAKSYTDAEITKLTGDTDGSLQKQITANKTAIQGNSDKIKELSAGTTAYTTTAVSEVKTELADVKKTADAAAVKKDVDTALESKVAKTDLGTYATQTGIQDALDLKANQSDLEKLEGKVDVITGTTLSGYVKTGATSDQKDAMTGYGLRAYANDAVSTAKATLEGNSGSTSATTTIIGAKKYADAVVKALSDGQVDANTQSISNNASKIEENKAAINNVKATADSAVQTVTNTSTVVTGVTFSKTDTKITLNLDSMVIDCGDF